MTDNGNEGNDNGTDDVGNNGNDDVLLLSVSFRFVLSFIMVVEVMVIQIMVVVVVAVEGVDGIETTESIKETMSFRVLVS